MPGELVTSSKDVVERFCVTSVAEGLFERWRHRRPYVYEHVMMHQSKILYNISLGDVERVCRATADNRMEHALGDVKRVDAERVEKAKDWRPDYAFTHILHYAMETLETLPTWLQFTDFVKSDPKGVEMLSRPLLEKWENLMRDGWDKDMAWHALRWRVGNEYYSFIREMYTVTYLRSVGLDVRAHPLADALFRVDAWLDRIVLSVYVRNSEYRDGKSGRKMQPQRILFEAEPPFRFEHLPLSKASQYGRIHLPPRNALDNTVRNLERALRFSE